VVLLYDILEIFGLPDHDGGALFFIVALERRFIGRAPINCHGLGYATMTTERFGQKPFGGVLIPVLCEQKIDGLTVRGDGAIEIFPRAFDFDIRFIQPPTRPHRALAPAETPLRAAGYIC
jgi:hypothetical protein